MECGEVKWGKTGICQKVWVGDQTDVWLSFAKVPAVNVSCLFFLLSLWDFKEVEVLQADWWEIWDFTGSGAKSTKINLLLHSSSLC